MKFATLPRGGARSAEKPIEIVLPDVEKPVPVVVRATSALEDGEAIRFALADARAKGSTDPKDGDPLYDIALWAATVAVGYLDADGEIGKRASFFDGGAAQVLKSLPTETIAYLFQQQQLWQEEVSPSFKARTAEELVASVRRIAEQDGDVFFSRCSPSTQTSCARFMAALLVSSRALSSPTGSPSRASTSTPSRRRPRKPSEGNRKS